MRSHLGRRPIAQSAVVHGKAIMMFRDRHDILCACLLEQISPCRRIEMLGLEHGDEIFVPELVLRSIRRNVMLVRVESRFIHISWIPLVAKGRNGIGSPM